MVTLVDCHATVVSFLGARTSHDSVSRLSAKIRGNFIAFRELASADPAIDSSRLQENAARK